MAGCVGYIYAAIALILTMNQMHSFPAGTNPYGKLESLLNAAKVEFEKFYEKNNKAAGTRVRKAMQDLKVLAQDIRMDVQNKKNQSL